VDAEALEVMRPHVAPALKATAPAKMCAPLADLDLANPGGTISRRGGKVKAQPGGSGIRIQTPRVHGSARGMIQPP